MITNPGLPEAGTLATQHAPSRFIGGPGLGAVGAAIAGAVLYSLSMLTRYRPETWTALVNVDAPGYAVPVEFILEVGLDAVPDLIAHALDQAPTQ